MLWLEEVQTHPSHIVVPYLNYTKATQYASLARPVGFFLYDNGVHPLGASVPAAAEDRHGGLAREQVGRAGDAASEGLAAAG